MDVHGFPPADTAAVFDGRSSSARFVGSSYVGSLLRSRAAAISETSENGEWATSDVARTAALSTLAEEPHIEHGAGELLGEGSG